MLFPATSIAPRFHALGFTKLKLEDLVLKTPSERYLLNEDKSCNNNKTAVSTSVTQPFDTPKTNALYDKMIDIFTEALGGDKVAANYALFLACAGNRLRTDEFPVGSLCVNFSIDCTPPQRRERLGIRTTMVSLTRLHLRCSLCVPRPRAYPWTSLRSTLERGYLKDYDRNRLHHWTFTARRRNRLCLGRNEIANRSSHGNGCEKCPCCERCYSNAKSGV